MRRFPLDSVKHREFLVGQLDDILDQLETHVTESEEKWPENWEPTDQEYETWAHLKECFNALDMMFTQEPGQEKENRRRLRAGNHDFLT